MLRTTVDVQEIRNRQKYPKNNSFAYRWRILDNFNKSIERQMFHLNVLGATNHRSLMNDKILQLHKGRYQSPRKDLIVDLAKEAMTFLEKRRHDHKITSDVEVTLSRATKVLTDRCFNTLFSFSTELNTILGLSELFITATEPQVKKRTHASENSIATFVQANLSTSLYRLVIEGKQDQIKFYILPADNILALMDIHLQYDPIDIWRAQYTSAGQVVWSSPIGVLNEDMVDVACAELLRQLIATTQERLQPNGTLEVEQAQYDMQEADPWELDNARRMARTSDFEAESGFGYDLAREDDSWQPVHDLPQVEDRWKPVHDLPKVHYGPTTTTVSTTSPSTSTATTADFQIPGPAKKIDDSSATWQILPRITPEDCQAFLAESEPETVEEPAPVTATKRVSRKRSNRSTKGNTSRRSRKKSR